MKWRRWRLVSLRGKIFIVSPYNVVSPIGPKWIRKCDGWLVIAASWYQAKTLSLENYPCESRTLSCVASRVTWKPTTAADLRVRHWNRSFRSISVSRLRDEATARLDVTLPRRETGVLTISSRRSRTTVTRNDLRALHDKITKLW